MAIAPFNSREPSPAVTYAPTPDPPRVCELSYVMSDDHLDVGRPAFHTFVCECGKRFGPHLTREEARRTFQAHLDACAGDLERALR